MRRKVDQQEVAVRIFYHLLERLQLVVRDVCQYNYNLLVFVKYLPQEFSKLRGVAGFGRPKVVSVISQYAKDGDRFFRKG